MRLLYSAYAISIGRRVFVCIECLRFGAGTFDVNFSRIERMGGDRHQGRCRVVEDALQRFARSANQHDGRTH